MAKHAARPPKASRRLAGWASALVLGLVSAAISIFPAQAALNPLAITFNDSVCDLAAAGYQGSGSATDPWQISDSDSLWEITDCEAQRPGGFFGLVANIDASLAIAAPLARPIGHRSLGNINFFSGTLDGNGFTVSGANVGASSQSQSSDISAVGLFAGLRNSEIRNLNLVISTTGATLPPNQSGNTQYSTGGLAGISLGVTKLANISMTVRVSGTARVGGVIGFSDNTIVSGVFVNGSVTGDWNVGGVVGAAQGFTRISESRNDASILAEQSATSNAAGGFVGGSVNSVLVENSENFGSVTSPKFTGGFVGIARSVSMSHLVNRGNIKASNQALNAPGSLAGGLLGFGGKVDIERSSNLASVAVWGSQAGGLVAKGELLTIKDSMNSGEVAASNHSAGGLTAWADVLIISNSVNSGKVVALSGAGGLATGVTIQAQFENSLNNGEMVLLVGPTSSTALNELGTPAANPPLPTASMDGILATGPLTAVQSFTTAPSKRSSTSTVTQLTDPDTYLGWNMDSVWGFDCSESAPMPKLRSIYQGANPLRVTCEVAPAMNPVQQDETGYRGPAVDSNYSTSARATGSLEVTGTSLSFVSKVWVGSFSASISSVSSTSLQLLLPPNIPEGLYDLILESTFGTFKAVGAVRIVATAEETVSPLVGKTKQIRNFTPGQISISDKQRRQLIEMLSIGSAKRLVCTAVTSKVMRLRARLELRSQAQATCAAISVMMPAATIRVQSKPTLHRHMVGRVLVTITG